MSDTIENIKGFWQRAEGKVGKFVLAAFGLSTTAFLWFYSAALVAMLANTLYAMILLGAIGTLLALASSPDVQNLVSVLFKIVIYRAVNFFVAIDPIAVGRSQIAKAKRIRDRIEDLLADFNAQVKALSDLIRQNKGKIQMAQRFMGEANQQLKALKPEELETMEGRAKRKAMILHARTAGRKEQSNKTYQDLLALAMRIQTQLSKAKDSADILIEDKEADMDERAVRSRMSKSVMAVLKQARSLRGALQDNALYDAAVEQENMQFAQALGALESFTTASADFIAHSDLANGIYEADALKRLEAMEHDGDALDTIVMRDGTQVQHRTGGESTTPVNTGGYNSLFK
jgi:hypothetical protein